MDLYNKKKYFEKVLVDFRNCRLNITRDDVIYIADRLEKEKKYPFMLAFLTEDPKNTALALLFEMFLASTFYCKVFSTEAQANAWLGVQ